MFLLIPSAFLGALALLTYVAFSPARRPEHGGRWQMIYACAVALIGLIVTTMVPLADILVGTFVGPDALQSVLIAVMFALGAAIAGGYLALAHKKGGRNGL